MKLYELKKGDKFIFKNNTFEVKSIGGLWTTIVKNEEYFYLSSIAKIERINE